MPVKHEYYTILVVDIEKFGRRRNPVQSWLRERLYRLLEEAFVAAGIEYGTAPPPVDRGDGVFWLLPGTVPKQDVTGPFVEALRAGLRAHARTSSAEGALRLRVVLHGGEVGSDGRGWVGADLNTACRMVDHQPLRDALAAAGDAELVVGVSDEWHRKVISHGYHGVNPAEYRPVRFDAKEVVHETVWLRVPGYAEPPGLGGAPEADGPARPATRPPAPAPAPPTAPPPGPAPAIEHNSGIGQLVGDITHGGMGVARGTVHQRFGAPAAPPARTTGDGRDEGDAAGVRRELEELRGLLKAALESRDIDSGTYQDASRELDTAEENAEAEDGEGRGRLLRALIKLGALIQGLGDVAGPVQRLITTLRGTS